MATNENDGTNACGAGPTVVVECEEHKYGKWNVLAVSPEYLEFRSCFKCGTSMVRPMVRVCHELSLESGMACGEIQDRCQELFNLHNQANLGGDDSASIIIQLITNLAARVKELNQ